METFPNQNMIKINKKDFGRNFIGIDKETWMSASRDLGAYGVQLYTYLASNKQGYKLALSYEAVKNATGMKKSTYYKYFDILKEKGYIVYEGKHTYSFYEVPRKEENSGSPSDEQKENPRGERSFSGQNSAESAFNGIEIPQNARLIPQNNTDSSQGNREININNEKISSIDNGIDREPKEFVFWTKPVNLPLLFFINNKKTKEGDETMNYFDLMEEHIQKIRKASGVTIENDISEQHRRMARQYFEARAKQAEAKEKQAEREKLKKEIILGL